MTKSISKSRLAISLAVPFILFAGVILLIKSSLFATQSSQLTFAISVDFLLFVPFVYFLLIRKTAIPKTTVVPMMLVGLFLATSSCQPKTKAIWSFSKPTYFQ